MRNAPTEPERLTLTRRECAAVMEYIWAHSRSAPNGTAFKVWQKMQAFVNGETEEEQAEPSYPLCEVEQ